MSAYWTQNREYLPSGPCRELVEASIETPMVIATAKNGSPTAQSGGRQVHSAYDPQRDAATWADQVVKDLTPSVVPVVVGTGLLYHVEALQQRLGSRPVYISISDPDALRQAGKVRRWDPGLSQSRWLWGTAREQAQQIAALGSPVKLLPYGPACAGQEGFLQQFPQALAAILAARQSGRLRIAVVGPMEGASWDVAAHVVQALRGLGHEVRWIDHRDHYNSYRSLAQIGNPAFRQQVESRLTDWMGVYTLASLFDDPPDLVIALAQAPLTLPVLDQIRRKGMTTVMWFVENYRHFRYWQQLAPGYAQWFVIQQEGCEQALRSAGAKAIHYLPMAADPSVHAPQQLTDQERARWGAQVAFLGAGYANRRAILPSLFRPEWRCKLWGVEWEQEPMLLPYLQAQGQRIDTATAVKIYSATDVNLNLHSWTGQGPDPTPDFVNPRTFELGAIGAFQLVDARTHMPALFPEQMLTTFSSYEEIPSLIVRYLHEPDERDTIAGRVREHVLLHHTYRHRMMTLLQTVGISEPDRIGRVLEGARQAQQLAARLPADHRIGAWLRQQPGKQRIEVKDLAQEIRGRGRLQELHDDELLVLLLDECRQETRDVL